MFKRLCLSLALTLPLVAGCTPLDDLLNVLLGRQEQVAPVPVKLLMTAAPPAGAGANGANNGLRTLTVTSGDVVIDTDAATMTVGQTVYKADVIKQDVPQTPAFSTFKGNPSVAVFNFDSLTIGSDVNVTIKGKTMLALVSQGDALIAASLDISGGNGQTGPGGAGRVGGGVGVSAARKVYSNPNPFALPGTSSPTDPYSDYTPMGRGVGGCDFSGGPGGLGGGGFGGAGGNGGRFGSSGGAPGGAIYGDLAAMLEGGSGGGSGLDLFSTGWIVNICGGGGAGGGAILIASDGNLTFSGTIRANGGNGGNGGYTGCAGGGGGSGGGIVLCGKTLAVTGTLSARGGNSGQPITCDGSGGGGGGKIVLYAETLNPAETTLAGSFTTAGGNTAGAWPGQNGQGGTYDLFSELLVVPSGQTVNSQNTRGFRLVFPASQVDAGGLWTLSASHTLQTLVGAGEVAINNSVLTIGDADASCEFSGVLSGNGQLVKTGAGTLTLSGPSANTCTGATTVAGGVLLLNKTSVDAIAGDVTIGGGTLQLGHDENIDNARNITVTSGLFDMQNCAETIAGLSIAAQGQTKAGTGRLTVSSLTGAGSLAGTGGELYVGSGSFAGTISGIFTLVKTGSGALTLQGNSTYTGQTVLAGGVLAAGSDTCLGDSQTGLLFSGGTLRVTGASWHSASRDITWQGGGIEVTEAGNTFAIGQSLGGTGSLTKTGPGTLALTGHNTYTGGTTVNAGTLRGPVDSLPGNIVNNATVIFDETADETFAGAISGTGNLVKTGTAALTLSGTNIYEGTTSATAGTLKAVGQTSLPATSAVTVAGGAKMELCASSGNYVVANTIAGPGMLLKSGADKVELTGTLAYTGATQVTAGALKVGLSSLGSSSEIIIDSAGSLETHGTTVLDLSSSVGTIKADGVLTLGNASSLSGYTFAGTLDANSQVVYLYSADKVVMGQTALLSGGKLMAATGLGLDTGKSISGHGQIRGDVDLGNGGIVHGDASKISVYGDVTGTGTLINVNVYGQVGPDVTQTTE
jgi:fibronectin-binding autotransporter adhesin